MALDTILERPQSRASICMGDATDAVQALNTDRFELVLFCAKEFGPPPQVFDVHRGRRTARVYHAPLEDVTLTRDALFTASRAAEYVTGAFLAGKPVLVTCMQGRNRSGLVVALALHMMSGAGGNIAMRAVRERRLHVAAPALVNASFVRYLENLPPRSAGPRAITLHDSDAMKKLVL